ncbi:MAG: NTP transferase domain-containing protein [Acidobacteriota bacterium]|nr:NTP transferase domain-containing protein [Acidobacteriota bacterium]
MDVTVAVLAGGLGTRIGGDKALVQLAGRPLISYPIAAAQAAGLDVVVVAKRTTQLPPLDVPVILEPDAPVHPLLGVITALEELPAILAIPCDMPLLRAAELAALAAMPDDLATLWPNQPFPSLYRRPLLPQLRAALEANQSMRATQAQSLLAPAVASSTDSAPQLSVNTAEDLASAAALLRAG